MVSYFHKEFSISLLKPEDWKIESKDIFPLILFAPKESGFSANIGFIKSQLHPPSSEHLRKKIAEIKQNQKLQYANFAQIYEKEIWLDSYPAYFQQFEWTSKKYNKNLSHIFGLIMTGEDALFEVNASSLKELSKNYNTIFSRRAHG